MSFPPTYPTHSFSPPLTRLQPLQPYLGSRARLSQSWLSQHFLALILIFIALVFLLSQIANLVSDAKSSLRAGCGGVEGAANVLVSLPHYMAEGVNELNQKSVKAVTNGAAEVLDLVLVGITQIILFMIDLYRSLFLCLMDLAVHGGLTLLIDATEEIDSFVTSTFQEVRSDVQSAVEVINEGLNATLGLIDDIPGDDFTIPQVTIPSLDFLSNVTLPSSILSGLTSLNDSIPTLSELRSTLDSLISTPINALRTEINSTLSNATIDISLLPVPAKDTVELCTNLNTSFLDDVGHDLAKFLKIALGLIVLLAALLVLAGALYERWEYQRFLEGVQRAREAWLMDLGHSSSAPSTSIDVREVLGDRNLLSFLSASQHPTLALYLSRFASFLRLTPSGRARAHWFGAYIFHPSALAFLALGLVGIIVVQIQLAVLEGPVKDLAQRRAGEGAGEFSTSVLSTINGKMNATSVEWAEGSNKVITALQTGINDDLFGWVNTTTEAMNSTINTFYDGITDALTDVFNGTVLEDPVLDLVYCLIGSKVTAISTALTWIHNHAHISLPLVSSSALLLSQNQTTELTSDLTNPNSTVSTTNLVDKMVETYASSLRQQRLGFIVCIVIWGIVVLMALVGLFWELKGRKWWVRRGWGGKRGGGRELWKDGRGRSMSEKGDLKPFHLRAESLNHVRADSPELLPPRALGDSPPHSATPSSSSTTWGSLLDFFKPTSPPSSDEPAHEMTATPTPSRRPFAFPLPKPPTLRLPKAHFPLPTWELPSSSYPSRTAPRRHSDEMDLRSGELVGRSYPQAGSRRVANGRTAFKGAAGRLAVVMRGMKRGGDGGGGVRKRRSAGGEKAARWARMDEGDDECDLRRPPTAPALRHPLQQPLSPPPRPTLSSTASKVPPIGVGSNLVFAEPQHPYATPSSFHLPLRDAFPPLIPSPPKRRASTYRPGSRPRPPPPAAEDEVNPFSTPFDDPDEGQRGAASGAGRSRAVNPFASPFDGVRET
ncbi:hypothetical protein BCR35DRAFT_278952 [Leucosporidium creatinivorum]|uniref:Plasma membrane fusion protein PRM1 n=1 Tax=Leucosporidium creatinivorum TaxID=106004 RepID=A0A1Y2FCV2_9BASI|nr:hypothetical protein BCR35DRAFT_278952 [Leucosporidium creatinivorum]